MLYAQGPEQRPRWTEIHTRASRFHSQVIAAWAKCVIHPHQPSPRSSSSPHSTMARHTTTNSGFTTQHAGSAGRPQKDNATQRLQRRLEPVTAKRRNITGREDSRPQPPRHTHLCTIGVGCRWRKDTASSTCRHHRFTTRHRRNSTYGQVKSERDQNGRRGGKHDAQRATPCALPPAYTAHTGHPLHTSTHHVPIPWRSVTTNASRATGEGMTSNNHDREPRVMTIGGSARRAVRSPQLPQVFHHRLCPWPPAWVSSFQVLSDPR